MVLSNLVILDILANIEHKEFLLKIFGYLVLKENNTSALLTKGQRPTE